MTELINTVLNSAEQEEISKITGGKQRGGACGERARTLVVAVQRPSYFSILSVSTTNRFTVRFEHRVNRQGYCSKMSSKSPAVSQTNWLRAGVFQSFFQGSPVKPKLRSETTVKFERKNQPTKNEQCQKYSKKLTRALIWLGRRNKFIVESHGFPSLLLLTWLIKDKAKSAGLPQEHLLQVSFNSH